MSTDFKAAKDTLVALLFELSKSAQDAAAAAVDFYRLASDDPSASSATSPLAAATSHLQALGSSILQTIQSAGGNDVDDDDHSSSKTKKEKVPKKKKAERDPNAPKKPLTIYFAFAFHTRAQIRAERKEKGLPALPAAEMSDIVKERWNSITPEEKSYWQEKYAAQLKDYQNEKEKYQTEKGENAISAGSEIFGETSLAKDPTNDIIALDVADLISADVNDASSDKEKKKEKKRKGEKKEKSEKKKKWSNHHHIPSLYL